MGVYYDPEPEVPSDPDERTALLPSYDEAIAQQRRRYRFSRCCLLVSALLLGIPFIAFLVYVSNNGFRFVVPSKNQIKPQSIAIVGAGPAGIACALSLESLAKAHGLTLNITIFETANQVGGRLALDPTDRLSDRVHPYDDPTQEPISAEDVTGNTLIYDNVKMRQAAEGVLQRLIPFVELPAQDVGYFDGEKLTSWASRPAAKTSWSRWLSQSWKYGSFVVRSSRSLVEEAKDQIKRLSGASLNQGIVELLRQSKNSENILRTAQAILDTKGISSDYQHEVIDPQIRRMLGMASHGVNGLQFAAALAIADSTDFRTEDDAFLSILAELASSSSAALRLGHTVTELSHRNANDGSASWEVRYLSTNKEDSNIDMYDHAILTIPGLGGLLNDALDVSSSLAQDRASVYQPVYVTFFAAQDRLDPEIFNESSLLPDQILFVDSPALGVFRDVNELAFVRHLYRIEDGETVGPGYLYRFLSTSPIDMTSILSNCSKHPVIDWSYYKEIVHGYPVLFPHSSFPSFNLDQRGLWRTSAIESVGSSIDLSWAAGEAVASMVIKDILSEAAESH